MSANPGSAGYPATIYQLKTGAVAPGASVALDDVLVTGRSAGGFFLQVKPGDPGNSFLLLKLRLTDPADPLYGSGQPASAPGSICAAAQDVIAAWIAQGAQDN